jgi:toxin-antitoxin system PIN domain toxin
MTDLLDVNVWLALVDENHAHRSAALHYWRNEASELIAFCRVSMLGFLRLSTLRGVLSSPLTPERAWAVYGEYLQEPGVAFLSEPSEVEKRLAAFSLQPSFRPQLWTDAYLAALALSSGCRLVSFDSDFRAFDGLNFLHLTPV